MIRKLKVLAIIQARGGSKGIPKKNITDIAGFPLISYTIYAALNSKYIDKLLVSTDSQEIASVSKKYGAEIPFLRDGALAGDIITSVDSLSWFVKKYQNETNDYYDIIIELPAVSPFRTNEHIDLAIEKLVITKSDSVISVVDTGEKHPTRLKKIDNDLIADFTKEFPEPEKMSRRQDLKPCYIRNGAIYVMTNKTLLNDHSRSGKISRPFLMEDIYSTNIDTKYDLLIAKLLIHQGFCENFPGKIKLNSLKKIKTFNEDQDKTLLITTNLEMFNNNEILDGLKFKIIYYPDPDFNETISLLNDYNINFWICSPCPNYLIDELLFNGINSNIDVISTPSTGTTHIDLDYCIKNKIDVYSIKDSPNLKKITASSEYSFLHIINSVRKYKISNQFLKIGYWREQENKLRGNEMYGTKLGVIGAGRIGSNVIRYAKAFNMDVSYYDPNVKLREDNILKVLKVEEIFKNCDVILVSIPFNKENIKFISNRHISLMKDESILVNTSRGEVIDEECIYDKLINSSKFIYCCDVIQNEQDYTSNKLFQNRNNLDNLIMTPHIAGLSYQSELKAFKYAYNFLK